MKIHTHSLFTLFLAAVFGVSLLGQGFAQDMTKIEKRVKVMRGGGECIPDLTNTQKEQIKKIRLELQKALLPLRSQLEVKSAELKSLLVADNPDAAKINAKLDEIGALRTQIQKKRLTQELEIRKLLTSEQRVVFDERVLQGFDSMERGMKQGLMRRMRRQCDPNGEFESPCMIEREDPIDPVHE